MIKLVSHCHTHHSFDSSLKVESIIFEAIKKQVNVIIINDHDVFSMSEEELYLFKINNIIILRAIEFTTTEGVHVIGVHEDIKLLQKKPFHYSIFELLNLLKSLDAKVIFPHPYHATGIYGNKNISEIMFLKSIIFADAIEIDNYRYGKTPSFLVNKFSSINPNIIFFIGSDAHKKDEVTAFVNSYDLPFEYNERDVFLNLFNNNPIHLRLKVRGPMYFKFRRFQKSILYQTSINLLSPSVRKNIKKFFKFW